MKRIFLTGLLGLGTGTLVLAFWGWCVWDINPKAWSVADRAVCGGLAAIAAICSGVLTWDTLNQSKKEEVVND